MPGEGAEASICERSPQAARILAAFVRSKRVYKK